MSVSENLGKIHHQQALMLYALSGICLALGDRRFKEGSFSLSGKTGYYAFLCVLILFMRWMRKQIPLKD
jgi:hypothetical protein